MLDSWIRKLALFGYCSLSLVLASCGDQSSSYQSVNTENTLKVSPPRMITRACDPSALNLGLSLEVNGVGVTMSPSSADNWTGTARVPSGQDAVISLVWTHNSNIELATLRQTFANITSDRPIQIFESDYLAVDSDDDKHVNIDELCASPPSEINNDQSVPATSTTASDPVFGPLHPRALQLNAGISTETSGVFQFRNDSEGSSQLTFNVSSNQTWLTLEPQSGSINAGQTQTVTARTQCGTAVSSFSATITVATNAGTQSLPITLQCTDTGTPAPTPTGPAVLSAVSPASLSLNAEINQPATSTFSFSNQGDELLNYTIISDQAWLIVSPASDALSGGQSASISVTANCGAQAGTATANLSIQSNGGNATVPVSVECQTASVGAVLSDLAPASISVSATVSSSTSADITFRNSGDTALNYTVAPTEDFFTVAPTTAVIQPGETETLTVTFQCGATAGTLSGNIQISGNFPTNPSIPVSLECTEVIVEDTVFAVGQYEPALTSVFSLISGETLGFYAGLHALINNAVVQEMPDTRLFVEQRRFNETVNASGQPVYSVEFACTGGGTVLGMRDGSSFEANFQDCQLGFLFINGDILDGLQGLAGLTTRGRFSGLVVENTAQQISRELTGNVSLGTVDILNSEIRHSDFVYSETNASGTFTAEGVEVTQTFLLATLRYIMDFSYSVTGDVTFGRTLRVQDNGQLTAAENGYYEVGGFTVSEVGSASRLEIDANSGDISTFLVTVSHQGAVATETEEWTDTYKLGCGGLPPVLDGGQLFCRQPSAN